METLSPVGIRYRFQKDQILAFTELSHDLNPLHVDEGYARRTPFGQTVVYGMAGVLASLGVWAQGREFSLIEIKGQFKKPLFLNEDYEIKFKESSGQVQCEWFKGSVLVSKIVWVWKTYTPKKNGDIKHLQFIASVKADTFKYSLEGQRLSRFEVACGLRVDQMPLFQIQAHLGASYFVGMEFPGKQALFSEFHFRFDPEWDAHPTQSSILELELKQKELDSQFNRALVKAAGPGVVEYTLIAFRRPEPPEVSLERIEEVAQGLECYSGQNIFISGASRGYGAVLSRVLAHSGANVVLNSRSQSEESTVIEAEVSRVSPSNRFCYGDLATEAGIGQLNASPLFKTTEFDWVFANASPPILGKYFEELTSEEWMSFLDRSVRMNVHLLRSVLPRMRPGASLVLISSVFVGAPARQFSHYVASKAALEGLFRSVALEYPKLRFVICRLPKMLTDQTQLPFNMENLEAPWVVAGRMLKKMNALALVSQSSQSAQALEFDLS